MNMDTVYYVDSGVKRMHKHRVRSAVFYCNLARFDNVPGATLS